MANTECGGRGEAWGSAAKRPSLSISAARYCHDRALIKQMLPAAMDRASFEKLTVQWILFFYPDPDDPDAVVPRPSPAALCYYPLL